MLPGPCALDDHCRCFADSDDGDAGRSDDDANPDDNAKSDDDAEWFVRGCSSHLATRKYVPAAESCRAARYGEDEDAVAMVEDAQDSSMRRGRPFKARRFNELQ